MNSVYVPQLTKNDIVHVVAPSRSMSIISKQVQDTATQRLNSFGLNVSFGKYINNSNNFCTTTVEERVEDLHSAFLDPNIKGVFSVIGGFYSNHLLDYIDFDILKSNPKVFCGYSDITILVNAIYRKCGYITYYGPHYSTLGMVQGIDYTLNSLKDTLFSFSDNGLTIEPSRKWSDDLWFLDQDKRVFIENSGPVVLNKGIAKGRAIGGNLFAFDSLRGTEYMPDLEDSILFLECDDTHGDLTPALFDKIIYSILQHKGAKGIKGIVLGRFQNSCKFDELTLCDILKAKNMLSGIPIVYNMSFGHTTPQFTIPIGADTILDTQDSENVCLQFKR
ncbi:MAG: S66 peptidase family protein [Oligoflexales bacterium]